MNRTAARLFPVLMAAGLIAGVGLALVYAGLSVVTFVAYAMDKSAAVQGQWRTPESTLH